MHTQNCCAAAVGPWAELAVHTGGSPAAAPRTTLTGSYFEGERQEAQLPRIHAHTTKTTHLHTQLEPQPLSCTHRLTLSGKLQGGQGVRAGQRGRQERAAQKQQDVAGTGAADCHDCNAGACVCV